MNDVINFIFHKYLKEKPEDDTMEYIYEVIYINLKIYIKIMLI